jgi:hypothetical protein
MKEEQRKQLSTICGVCNEPFSNVRGLSPSDFLKLKTCSSECSSKAKSLAKLASNPMKNPDVVSRNHAAKSASLAAGLWEATGPSLEGRARISQRMRTSNPSKVKKTVLRMVATRRARYTKEYLQSISQKGGKAAMLQHLQELAAGGYEKAHRFQPACNLRSLPVFTQLASLPAWAKDEVYFAGHPYEYPIVVSEDRRRAYFPDLYNKSRELIIEWDEVHHQKDLVRVRDAERTESLLAHNPRLRIVRIDEASLPADEADWLAHILALIE